MTAFIKPKPDGALLTVTMSLLVGSGMGPLTCTPIFFAKSTISLATWSTSAGLVPYSLILTLLLAARDMKTPRKEGI